MAATIVPITIHPFWSGFGVFTGIISGIAINIILQWHNKRKRKNEIIKNIKFETSYNIEHINSLLGQVNDLRKSVSVDNPSLSPCYLNISHKIQASTVMAYRHGLLYEIMSRNHIANLMKFSDDFSKDFEKLYNQDIYDIIHNLSKPKAGERLNFIEKTIKVHHRNLSKALASLP